MLDGNNVYGKDLLHDSYKKSASTKNKLSFHTQLGVHLYNSVDEAEAIGPALPKRAEIETLNMAGNSPAWPGWTNETSWAAR